MWAYTILHIQTLASAYLDLKLDLCWVLLVSISLEFLSYQSSKIVLVSELELEPASLQNGSIQGQYFTRTHSFRATWALLPN